MASNRPARSAKDRALQFFQRGFRADDDDDLMDEDEEDLLDQEMLVSDIDTSDSEPEDQDEPQQQQPRVRPRVHVGQGDGPDNQVHIGYDAVDVGVRQENFSPYREPGVQLGRLTRNGILQYTTALSIFSLFFNHNMLQDIVDNTNTYAWLNVINKPSYGNPDGGWQDVTLEDMKNFISCIIYMGFVEVSSISLYWSTQTLYNGLWARRFMSRDKFTRMLAFLHVSDPLNEPPADVDKLRKVRNLLDHIRDVSVEMYQPDRQVSVDERMVRSKHRSGFRQFIKDKPCRFGFKLFILAESKSGYTLKFKVYTGRNTNEPIGDHGLGYSSVMNLMEGLLDQGYEVFYDNWYTGVPLAEALLSRNTFSCGTIRDTRIGFPEALKGRWQGAQRGNLRYVRQERKLFLQWQDTKTVSVLSTFGVASNADYVRRTVKVNGQWRQVIVRRPEIIANYNQSMGGVDRSDQLISQYNVLMRTEKWWKVFFFHMLDVAIVNSYIIFNSLRERFPNLPALHRPSSYGQLQFREELVRQLSHITNDESVPVPRCTPAKHDPTPHYPDFKGVSRNCRLCWVREHVERKSQWGCSHPDCHGKHLCLNGTRNCYAAFHRRNF